MNFLDFEIDDEIKVVEENLIRVKTIRDNFADYTHHYRDFSKVVKLEYKMLADCINAYERSLLISVYSYAEQLIKNFYYALIYSDMPLTDYAKRFIEKKLDPEKFSPNVNYTLIEKNVRDELFSEFKFLIKNDREEIKKYNDLISYRHRYAHRGVYQASFEQYADVIKVEKYISLELKMVVSHGMEYRIKYQNEWKKVIETIQDIEKLYNQYIEKENKIIKQKISGKLKELKKIITGFYNAFSNDIQNNEFLTDVEKNLNKVKDLDLRKKTKFDTVAELFKSLKDSRIIYYK